MAASGSSSLQFSGSMSLNPVTGAPMGAGSMAASIREVAPLGADLPNLPHFRKNKQVARPLLHNFSGSNGTVYEKHWKPAEVDHLAKMVSRAEELRGISTADKEAIAQRKAQAAASRSGSMDYQSNLTEIPVDVQTEKQVLRAFAYYQESVPESREETFRIRKVQIHCHLEDQTIAVIESKEDNSGLPQGTILKRGRVPKRPFDPEIDLPEELRQQQAAVAMTASKGGMEDTFGVVGRGGRVARKAPTTTSGAAGMLSKIGGGGAEEFVHYDWQDLLIGNEVQFYGRSYRIYNVDGFTRRWYAQAGIDQGPPEGVPTDPHGDKLEAETQRAGPKSRRGHNKQMYGVKEHMEAMRGKFVRDPRRRAQFQDFDGKVLRFDTIWDQRGQEGGDVAHYCLTYFLADDEVEVREMHATNNGKDPFPALLKKSPLPKQWQTAMDAGNDAVRHRPELFVRPADLRVGGTVDVYGRTLQIRAVDPFTRHFYSTVLRQPQPEARWEATQQHAPTEHVIPPHTGYGTEADSKLSVRYVRPLRGPKKNYNKWMVHDGQVFRWRARLVNKVPQDVVRRFSIAFFPSDDTMSVFEPPLRNTGVMGGKMLRRGEYKTNQGKEFDPATFVPGSTIVLAGNTFEILDADPFTRSTLPSVDEPAVEVYYANLTKSVPPTVTRQAELAELAAKEAEAEAAEDARRQEARELRQRAVQAQRAREAELVTAAKQEVSKGSVPGMAVPANVPIPSMYATTNGSYGLPGF